MLFYQGIQSFTTIQVFEERSKEHEIYGGDPEQPHKLHVVTRVKSTKRRPYWEKKVVKSLGLLKVSYISACRTAKYF